MFLQYFNQDSIFQISRVNFPLKVKCYDIIDGEDKEKIYTKSNYLKLDFSKNDTNKSADNFTIEREVKGNKAYIYIRGIDNGIIVDFIFEKINGKWILIQWIDSST